MSGADAAGAAAVCHDAAARRGVMVGCGGEGVVGGGAHPPIGNSGAAAGRVG